MGIEHPYIIEAVVSLKIKSEMRNILINALKPESELTTSERSQTSINFWNDKLVIISHASDVTALRAALNSYLHWIQGILNIVDELEKAPKS
jgi:tRNA threonylcarbamoyladenosine modification (KEOPS) complex  Pcc1 subunit